MEVIKVQYDRIGFTAVDTTRLRLDGPYNGFNSLLPLIVGRPKLLPSLFLIGLVMSVGILSLARLALLDTNALVFVAPTELFYRLIITARCTLLHGCIVS